MQSSVKGHNLGRHETQQRFKYPDQIRTGGLETTVLASLGNRARLNHDHCHMPLLARLNFPPQPEPVVVDTVCANTGNRMAAKSVLIVGMLLCFPYKNHIETGP